MGNLLQSRGTPLSTDIISETVYEIRDMEWIFMYEDTDANTDYHAELYMEMARSADALEQRIERFVGRDGSFLPVEIPGLDCYNHRSAVWAWLAVAFALLHDPVMAERMLDTAFLKAAPDDFESEEDTRRRDNIRLFQKLSRVQQRLLMKSAAGFAQDFFVLRTAYETISGLISEMNEHHLNADL